MRSDNLCLTDRGVVLIDWNLACLGNPELDTGFWLPSLELEGGPAPEAVLPRAPEVASWVSGFFAARAGLPHIPDAPRVRAFQRAQLVVALAWAARALELPASGNRYYATRYLFPVYPLIALFAQASTGPVPRACGSTKNASRPRLGRTSRISSVR